MDNRIIILRAFGGAYNIYVNRARGGGGGRAGGGGPGDAPAHKRLSSARA